jgi:hypothetical protein
VRRLNQKCKDAKWKDLTTQIVKYASPSCISIRQGKISPRVFFESKDLKIRIELIRDQQDKKVQVIPGQMPSQEEYRMIERGKAEAATEKITMVE